MHRPFASIVVLATLSAAAPITKGADEELAIHSATPSEIIVQWRHAMTVCAGICLDLDVRIDQQGLVSWRSFPALIRGGRSFGAPRGAVWRVGKTASRLFVDRLSALRPSGRKIDNTQCSIMHHQQGVWNRTIIWVSSTRRDELRTCDGYPSFDAALRAIGIEAGEPSDKTEALPSFKRVDSAPARNVGR